MILFRENARQDPPLLRVMFQQRGQIRFGLDRHVGENRFALTKDFPSLDSFANGKACLRAPLFPERFSDRPAVLAQLRFL